VFTVDEDDVRPRLESNAYYIYGWSVFPEASVLCSHMLDNSSCARRNIFQILVEIFNSSYIFMG